jgi:hypothetical protein
MPAASTESLLSTNPSARLGAGVRQPLGAILEHRDQLLCGLAEQLLRHRGAHRRTLDFLQLVGDLRKNLIGRSDVPVGVAHVDAERLEHILGSISAGGRLANALVEHADSLRELARSMPLSLAAWVHSWNVSTLTPSWPIRSSRNLPPPDPRPAPGTKCSNSVTRITNDASVTAVVVHADPPRRSGLALD